MFSLPVGTSKRFEVVLYDYSVFHIKILAEKCQMEEMSDGLRSLWSIENWWFVHKRILMANMVFKNIKKLYFQSGLEKKCFVTKFARVLADMQSERKLAAKNF